MRDIPTIQGLRNRSVPATREQVMSELARLEHEKARLERELNIWLANQKKTEGRLQQLQERVNLLQAVMDEISPKKHKLDPGSEQAEKIDDKNGYHEVSLEY
jgi:peptidoglycan hydrolase CwlO-like protein